MSPVGEKGLTLVELLLAVAILGMIAAAATPLLSASMESYRRGMAQSQLLHEGLSIMEKLTDGVRRSTFLLIPNAHHPIRDVLAFSGSVNDDNDFYFNDPLFPRIDEDLHEDMTVDWQPGISGWDDDGNGNVDEGDQHDDDEDGQLDEDPIDGLDNDGDGNVDEDPYLNMYGFIQPGIKGMDDDGDGSVDEGQYGDDDEDGQRQEDPLNPVIYWFDSGAKTLRMRATATGVTSVLSTRVTAFQAQYVSPERTLISLTLTGNDGRTISFSEYVCPRNTLQKTGKRVK